MSDAYEEGSFDDVEVLVEGRDEIPDRDSDIPEQYRNKTREELIAEIDRERKEREELKKQSDAVAAMNSGLNQLNQNLTRPVVKEEHMPVQQPGETLEEFNKRLDEEFLDSPSKNLDKYFIKKLMPELQRFMGNNIAYSKKFAEGDPDVKATLERWPDEVEREIRNMNPTEKLNNPDVYKTAAQRVMTNHINEMIEIKLQEKLKEIEKKSENSNQNSGSYSYSEYGSNINRPSEKKKIGTLTREEAKRAEILGLDEKTYWRVLHGKK